MGGWRPWRALRERAEVDFALVDLPAGLRAVCAREGVDSVILIDRRLQPADRLAALAHELVHLERGGGAHQPDLSAPLRTLVLREERRVDAIVAERLVPSDELSAFVARRMLVEPITAEVVAEEFEIAVPVARRALELLVARLPGVA